ncbi:Arm DNA-binding domain-containing protein [Rhizosphaericola mali]|uniref:Arm DNA-binding domain-containing protein n=1 Tax=Rhizosphaericola mali TaxID=2545455 RepID=A0A5P2G387_9BACT|nr:Arm DNA-binding domain-containing protein [Rhizosphaericola mali]QES89667.1 hypothetical protein E0W69_013690 [Rhizosphaericola mali]
MNLNPFSIRFWQAKSRNVDGLSLIYARITINGDRIEISTNRKINAILWNAKLQKANGKSAEAQTLNNHLEAIKTSDFFHYLSIHEKLSNNRAMKYIVPFQKLIRFGDKLIDSLTEKK